MVGEGGLLQVELEGTLAQTAPITSAVLRIGRLPDNDLPLPHPTVSRRHAEIRQSDIGGLTITDLGSSYGTLLDSVKLLPNQPALLFDGSVIEIGPFRLTYRSSVQQAVPAAATAAPDPVPAAPEPVPAAPPPLPVEPIPPRPSVAPHAAPAAAPAASTNGPVAAPPPPPAARPPAPPAPPAPPMQPRPSFPARPATSAQSRYLRDLPVIYHENDFLGRFLLIVESIWEPIEQRQDFIDMYIDPRTAPATFLPWLAGWLEVSSGLGWPEVRLRRLIREGMDLYRWRGTRYGLARALEVCFGLAPEVTDSPTEPYVFRVKLRIPPENDTAPAEVERLIQAFKPAWAGYVLEITP